MHNNVLLVDDNRNFMKLLEDILPKQYPLLNLIFAGSIVSARQIINTLPDLRCLVTEYNLGMAGIDGIQLAEEVRAKFPKVKIILISSIMDDSLKNNAGLHNIRYCASKFDELCRWINFMGS